MASEDDDILAALNVPKPGTDDDDSFLAELNTPKHEVAWSKAVQRAKADGIDLESGVTSHLRSAEKQKELWDKRDKNPNPVAPPGKSHHEESNGGHAWDIAEGKAKEWLLAHPELGFRRPIKGDKPHFEYIEPKKFSKANTQNNYETRLGQESLPTSTERDLSEAILRHAAKGVSGGFSDEIAGAMGSMAEGIADLQKGNLTPRSGIEAYREKRDAYRAGDQQSENQHPVASALSDLGGSLATAPVVGVGNGVKGLVASGAKLGTLFGLGNSEADLTQGDVSGAAKDTAKGAAIGALTGLVIPGINKSASLLGDKARDAVGGVAEIFGSELSPNVTRALETLGVKEGAAPSKAIQEFLESSALPAEKAPPSILNEASESAPDALASVSSRPRVQAAQSRGRQAVREAKAGRSELPIEADPEGATMLDRLGNSRLPTGGSATKALDFGQGILGLLGRVGKAGGNAIRGDVTNLERALGNDTTKAEIIRRAAAGLPPAQRADLLRSLGLTIPIEGSSD